MGTWGDGLIEGDGGYYKIYRNNTLVISEVKTEFSKEEYVFCSEDVHCSNYNCTTTYGATPTCNQGTKMCQCTCKDEDFKLKIELKTDAFPSDTNWTLTTSTGKTFNKTKFKANTKYVDEYCLVDGQNNFEIIDTWGDGLIVGDEGGYYKMYRDNTVVISEVKTAFSKQEYVFCSANDHCSDKSCTTGSTPTCNQGTKMCECICEDGNFKLNIELETDKFPQDEKHLNHLRQEWSLTTSTGETINKTKVKFYPNALYKDEYCLVDGNFTITDKFGDGLIEGEGGYYKIYTDSTLVISEENTEFSKEEYYFCSANDHCSDKSCTTGSTPTCNQGTKMCQCTCKDEEFKLKIELKTDAFPEDTDWTLTTSTGKTFNKTEFEFEANKLYKDEYCLVHGNF